MNIYVIYFSPNGTTLKCLKNILSGMGNHKVCFIDMADMKNRQKIYEFSNKDIVLYGTITAAMLFTPNKEIFDTFRGNGASFIGIAQYGSGYYGISLKQLQNRATVKGFNVVALGAFIGQQAQDGSVAHLRPDENDARIQKKFGEDVMAKILDGSFKLKNKPTIGWSSSSLYNTIVFVRLFMQGKDYTLPEIMKTKSYTDKCIDCGKCESNCPVGAVNLKEKVFDTKKCIACYRCVNKCPKQAIEVTSKIMNNIVKDFGKKFKDKRTEPSIYL